MCASLAKTCKPPAVIVFNKASSSGIETYHISCQMYDAAVLVDDGQYFISGLKPKTFGDQWAVKGAGWEGQVIAPGCQEKGVPTEV